MLFSITRDGKRGIFGNFKHKYKSVVRFYNQNFWDFYKMRITQQLLGKSLKIDKPDPNQVLMSR